MNLVFLILIGIPLGLYLIVLIFSTRDFSPDGTGQAYTDDSAHIPPEPVALAAVDDAPHEIPSEIVAATAAATDLAVTPPSTIEQKEPNVEEATAIAAPVVIVVAAQDPATVQAADTSESIPATAVVAPAQEPAPDQAADVSEPLSIAATTIVASETTAESQASKVEPEPAPAAAPAVVEPAKNDEDDPAEPILSGQPLILPGDAPKYAFDYRGRLWVEKKRRGFFRQLRRPQLPPDDPSNNSNR